MLLPIRALPNRLNDTNWLLERHEAVFELKAEGLSQRETTEVLFAVGDVLYGRWEARVPWRGATGEKGGEIGEEIGSKIGNYKYNIIDDFNNAILSTRLNDEDVNNFAMFLGTLAKKIESCYIDCRVSFRRLMYEYGAYVSAD